MSLEVPARSAAVPAWSVIASPIGELLLATDGHALTTLYFEPFELGLDSRGVRDDEHPILGESARQLAEYFAGERTVFDLPLATTGTPFQKRVWAALVDIAYGETASYGEIARLLGLAPGASRAVGLANGANPVSIIIPCHRVIGANGSLTGYGGGLPRKRFLLDLERGALF